MHHRGVRLHVFKKLYKLDQPNVYSPIPTIVDLYAYHENLIADAAEIDVGRFC